MDIRTKLVFAQVSVALLSMLALGFAMFRQVEVALDESTWDRLDGVAELKVESVEQVIGGWHDRISLVASRTQLRQSLAGFSQTGSPDELERIERILQDAVEASTLLRAITLHDVDGNALVQVMSSAGLAEAMGTAPALDDPEITRTGGPRSRYEGVTFRLGTPPSVTLSSPLVLDSETLGYVYGTMVTDELVRLTGDAQGTGETGETMIVVRARDDVVRTLHPVRNAPPVEGADEAPPTAASESGEAQVVGIEVNIDGPAVRAIAGEEDQLLEGLTDYRGQIVMAATRYVPETDWGVIVKLDAAEQRRPIDEVRRQSQYVAAVFAAFAIMFGTLLGYRFAQPIHALAEAADKIGSGQLDARSGLEREDEVGLLARTFDEMAGALEDQVGLLSEFRRFFEVSLDMMCIASTDGYFKKVNPAFVRELGWPEEELLRRPFIKMVHPDDVESTVNEVQKLASGTPTIRFENRFLCMDGSYKLLRWNSFPEEDTGRLYAIARVHVPSAS